MLTTKISPIILPHPYHTPGNMTLKLLAFQRGSKMQNSCRSWVGSDQHNAMKRDSVCLKRPSAFPHSFGTQLPPCEKARTSLLEGKRITGGQNQLSYYDRGLDMCQDPSQDQQTTHSIHSMQAEELPSQLEDL